MGMGLWFSEVGLDAHMGSSCGSVGRGCDDYYGCSQGMLCTGFVSISCMVTHLVLRHRAIPPPSYRWGNQEVKD